MSFFFNYTASTEISTLSLPVALPISRSETGRPGSSRAAFERSRRASRERRGSLLEAIVRKLLARSEEHTSELHHQIISYAVFCLKKKNNDSFRCCIHDQLIFLPPHLL